MLIVTASHSTAKWQLSGQEFSVLDYGDAFSQYRIGGSAEHGFYAVAPDFGCGKSYSTPSDAIRSLLQANGCFAITIETKGE